MNLLHITDLLPPRPERVNPSQTKEKEKEFKGVGTPIGNQRL